MSASLPGAGRHCAGPRPGAARGQAAVELALALPLVALLLLALVQFGVVVHDQVLVVHAAREGARAAAVDARPEAAVEAVRAASSLPTDRLSVRVEGRGGRGSRVTVEVRYRAATAVPLIGPLLGDVSLRAAATMRVEGP